MMLNHGVGKKNAVAVRTKAGHAWRATHAEIQTARTSTGDLASNMAQIEPTE
jgi:hypothetical protein